MINNFWNRDKRLLIGILILNFIIIPCVIIFLNGFNLQINQQIIETLQLTSILCSIIIGYCLSKFPISAFKAFILLLAVILFDLISFEYDSEDLVKSYVYQSLNYIVISLFIMKLLFTYSDQSGDRRINNIVIRKLLKLLTGNRWVIVIGGVMGGIGKVLFDLDNNIFRISRESLVCREFFKDNFTQILSLKNCSFTIWASIAVYAYLGFISAIIGYYLIILSREQGASNRNRVKIGRMFSYGLSLGFATSVVLSSINDSLNLSRQIVRQEAVEEVRIENAVNQVTQEQAKSQLDKLYRDLDYFRGAITNLSNPANEQQIKDLLMKIKTVSLDSKNNSLIISSLKKIKDYLVEIIKNKNVQLKPEIIESGVSNIYDLALPSNDQSVIITGLSNIIEITLEILKNKSVESMGTQFLSIIQSSTTKAVELSQRVERGQLYDQTFVFIENSLQEIENLIETVETKSGQQIDLNLIRTNITELQERISLVRKPITMDN